MDKKSSNYKKTGKIVSNTENTKVYKPSSVKKTKSKNTDNSAKTRILSTKELKKEEAKFKKKKRKLGWKIFRVILFIFLAMAIIGTGIVIGVITGVIDKTDSVNLDELKLLNQSSFIYDKDGNEIAVLYGSENRITVEYKNIPQSVINAITSIEDERFFNHKGVDIKRTSAAIVTYILHGGKSDFGGSTITQQLVKNATDDKEASWTRKIREWYRAITLEKTLSKEEIFESYVNTIYLGDGAYGIEVASEHFFAKPLKDVNIAEAAILAAKIQSPEATNPYKSEEAKQKLLDRQKVVLNKMLELGKITKEEYDEAINYKIEFKKGERATDASKINSYYVDAVIEAVVSDLIKEKGMDRGLALQKLYTAGYKIYTPFDSSVQKVIDDAYNNSKLFYTDRQGKFMQSAMVVMDHTNGNVVGLIGGAGQKTGNLVLNRATQMPRQPGSCMKPFGAYGPAFELGISSPGAGVDDCQLTNSGGYNPGNYYAGFNGYVTVKNAIAQSMNLPALRTTQKVGIDYAFKFAQNCGMTRLVTKKQNPKYNDENIASLALGGLTTGNTVLEMATAYSTVANGGIKVTPKLYTKVLDNEGKDYLIKNTEATRVMKDSTAFMLTNCMEETIKTGTGHGYIRLGGNIAVAGKTGNTNDDFDQWFCGYTPYYTIACWNGYDDNEKKAINRGYPYTSVRLFNTVMNGINKGKAPKQFDVPNSVTKVDLCKVSGLVPTDACRADQRGSQVGNDYVAKDSIPTATCNIHKMVKVCNETGKIANEYCPNTTEKSFITRDYKPAVLTRDWGFMVPTETCDIHNVNTKNQNNNNNNEEDNNISIYKKLTTQ